MYTVEKSNVLTGVALWTLRLPNRELNRKEVVWSRQCSQQEDFRSKLKYHFLFCSSVTFFSLKYLLKALKD